METKLVFLDLSRGFKAIFEENTLGGFIGQLGKTFLSGAKGFGTLFQDLIGTIGTGGTGGTGLLGLLGFRYGGTTPLIDMEECQEIDILQEELQKVHSLVILRYYMEMRQLYLTQRWKDTSRNERQRNPNTNNAGVTVNVSGEGATSNVSGDPDKENNWDEYFFSSSRRITKTKTARWYIKSIWRC